MLSGRFGRSRAGLSIARESVIGSCASRWKPAKHVVWCQQDDCSVLLSLRTGRYFTLDGMGTLVWGSLGRGESLDAMAQAICRSCSGSPDPAAIAKDVRSLIAELYERTLIEPREPGERLPIAQDIALRETKPSTSPVFTDRGAAKLPLPSVFFCVISFALIDLGLRIFGLRRVLNRVYTWSPTVRWDEVPGEWLTACARQVTRAAILYPFRAQCLEESLLLLWILRRAKVEAVLRIGILPAPFEAHAWVEHRGHPVNCAQEFLNVFVALPPLDPHTVRLCS